MKFERIEPPREFEVGRQEIITLKDCARIELDENEQVTFTTDSGAEYDVVRKAWGFYATPSLNGRLPQFGIRTVLVKSPVDRYYVLLVEREREAELREYLDKENHTVLCWLDDETALRKIETAVAADEASG